MASLLDDARHFLPGRQAYFFDVPGTDSAAALSVVSVTATERMGAPTEVRVVLTHPLRLPRTDFLNRDAACTIIPDDGVPRRFSGFIARFSTLQTTHDFTKYEIVLKSHFARLEAVTTSRIYQHQTTPQIIEAVLRSHGLEGHQFDFRLRREHPKHLFRFQHKTDDLSYVQMLMQKAGIYSYIVETEHGDQVVFADDIDHYLWDPHLTVPYCEVAGLEASGTEAVTTLKTHTTTVPQSFIVADYNPEQAWERFRDEANIAPQDSTTYGQPYIYGTHHLDQTGAKWEAQLRHEAAIAWQVVYDGESNVLALQPGRVLDLDTTLPDAPDGQVVIEVTHTGTRDRAYTNTYQAIPANRRFRLKLDEAKWPKIAGTLSARVTSPDKYKYAYLTAAGYYVVRFDVDFADWPSGGESVPLRLAKPFAGKLQTGMHFPALDNDEAVIAFRDADPDKPEIIAFHHHSQARDLVTSDRRWLSRNMIRTQANNKLRMEDWAGQEGIKLSTEHSGTTHLDLGYLVDEKLERRGEGFELRTSGHGVERAGSGLHLTAYDRPGAAGQQLDMQETIAQIESALALAKSLADATRTAKAIPADTDAQQTMKDDFDQLKQPGILASAPASIGIVAGGGVQVAAQDNISAVAGKNADFSVLKRFTVAAGELVSLLAQKLGIKIFAAQGPVAVQAQSDAMSLTAAKDVSVASVNGKVMVSAAKELILECGGAFIQLKDGNITLGGPLDLFLKVITIQKKGPAQMHLAAPAFSSTVVPFTFACDAWRRPIDTDDAVSPSLAQDASDWKQLGNPATTSAEAPAPIAHTAASPSKTPTQQPQQKGGTDTPTPAVSDADQDSAHEPKKPLADDASVPIKLAKPVACDWHTPAFTHERTDKTETAMYFGLDAKKRPWPTPDPLGDRPLSGNQFETYFELSYDDQSKTLYATVRVQLTPADIFRCDQWGKPLAGTDGKPQSVPFDHEEHWQVSGNGVDNPVGGYVMKYRDGPGETFNVAVKKRQIEAVLNGHKSKLILNGCSREAACGCRVSVVFKVDLLVSVKGATVRNGKKIHKNLNLFPRSHRADSGSWGELNMYQEQLPDKSFVWHDMPYDTNVIAHECGHLFNYPDEYWESGGWVHKQYIKDQQLDFALGDANKQKETWQISSATNVMGGGANQPVSSGDGTSSSATVHPYYLEYIRRHFCELTGEKPQYENGDHSKPIWKKWRIGHEN